jgi:predicted Zn-dependent protease
MKNFLIIFSVCFILTLIIPKKFFRDFDKIFSDANKIVYNSGNKNTLDGKTLKYFNDVTLKNELNDNKKTTPCKFKEDVKIFVHGDCEKYMIDEVNSTVNDLNNIIDPIEIYIVDNKNEANMVIYFGNYSGLIKNNKNVTISKNRLSTCDGAFMNKSTKSGRIKSSLIFINLPNNQSTLDTKEAVREEITQGIGFYNDTWDYPNSCFYQGPNTVLEYPEIDVKLIKHLYNEL